MSYAERFFTSQDGLRLFYRDYAGPGGGRAPVLCLPGLTRNSRDFDFIAGRMAGTRRVIAADLRGRGRSAYDSNYRNYAVPVELFDVLALMTAADAAEAIVLGTSRGGLIAMAMATMRPTALKGVILNDIGPELTPTGLRRILDFVGREPDHASWEEAAAATKAANAAGFTDLSDDRWLAFARARFREDNGRIAPDYDPKLGDATREAFAAPPKGAPDPWAVFGALAETPALVLRGANSDLLSEAAVDKMKAAKPDLETATVANRGHAPLLDEPEAVAAIEAFLERLG